MIYNFHLPCGWQCGPELGFILIDVCECSVMLMFIFENMIFCRPRQTVKNWCIHNLLQSCVLFMHHGKKALWWLRHFFMVFCLVRLLIDANGYLKALHHAIHVDSEKLMLLKQVLCKNSSINDLCFWFDLKYINIIMMCAQIRGAYYYSIYFHNYTWLPTTMNNSH